MPPVSTAHYNYSVLVLTLSTGLLQNFEIQWLLTHLNVHLLRVLATSSTMSLVALYASLSLSGYFVGKFGEWRFTLAGYRIPAMSTSYDPVVIYSGVTTWAVPLSSKFWTNPRQTYKRK